MTSLKQVPPLRFAPVGMTNLKRARTPRSPRRPRRSDDKSKALLRRIVLHRKAAEAGAADSETAFANLLLLLHVHAGDGVSPFQLKGGGVTTGLVEGDGELLQRGRALTDLHIHAHEVLALAVLRSPLPGL